MSFGKCLYICCVLILVLYFAEAPYYKLSTVISACLRCTMKWIRKKKLIGKNWMRSKVRMISSHSSVWVVLFRCALLFYCAIMQCPYRLFPFRFSFLSFIYANNDTMDGTRWISSLCFSSLNCTKALSCFWPVVDSRQLKCQ